MKKRDKDLADAIIALVGIVMGFTLMLGLQCCRTSAKKQDFRDRDMRASAKV